MTDPDAPVMLALSALAHVVDAAWDQEGDRLLVVHDMGRWWVAGTELGELESLGWVAVTGDGPDADPDVSVTDKGRYWLGRWERTPAGRTAAANAKGAAA